MKALPLFFLSLSLCGSVRGCIVVCVYDELLYHKDVVVMLMMAINVIVGESIII